MNRVIRSGSVVKVLVVGSAIAIAGFGLFQTRERWSAGFNFAQLTESKLEVLPSPTATPNVKPIRTDLPRSLKLRLTLDTPVDLKVKQSDIVAQGQVISDRTSVRKDLMGQQRSLIIQLGQLKERGVTPDRPIPSFAVEQTKIESAKRRVNQAKLAIADFWVHLPYTQTAWNLLSLPTERAKLATLEAQMTQAEVDLKLAVAQLQLAKDDYQVLLFKDRHQRDSVREQELVLARLKEVEGKLARVEVRSPNTGTIKKVKWLGQNDHELQVEVTLAIQEAS